MVAHEVKQAKNAWFQIKAKEIEISMMKGGAGKGVWTGLREIQSGRMGLQPVKPRAVRTTGGQLCKGPSETLQRWRSHFEGVLNVESTFLVSAIQAVDHHPTRDVMSEPPNEEEVRDALKGLKSNKAGGKDGIIPEMVKHLGSNHLDYVLDLFRTVWKEESVPSEWRDAILVPIPKKGDLSIYDNWRGISLLDTMGELFAKVIQRRLQVVVEEVLPDS